MPDKDEDDEDELELLDALLDTLLDDDFDDDELLLERLDEDDVDAEDLLLLDDELIALLDEEADDIEELLEDMLVTAEELDVADTLLSDEDALLLTLLKDELIELLTVLLDDTLDTEEEMVDELLPLALLAPALDEPVAVPPPVHPLSSIEPKIISVVMAIGRRVDVFIYISQLMGIPFRSRLLYLPSLRASKHSEWRHHFNNRAH